MPVAASNVGLSATTYRAGAARLVQVMFCAHRFCSSAHNNTIQTIRIYVAGRLIANCPSWSTTSAFLVGHAISLTSCLLPPDRRFIGYLWGRAAQTRRCMWTLCSHTLGLRRCAPLHDDCFTLRSNIVQIHGRKSFTIFPPRDLPFLVDSKGYHVLFSKCCSMCLNTCTTYGRLNMRLHFFSHQPPQLR